MGLRGIEWDCTGIALDFFRDNVTGAGMKKESHRRSRAVAEYSRNGTVFANAPAYARIMRRIKWAGFP